MPGRWFLALAVACSAHNALASPLSDPTAGRAVFTGATTADATSIRVNPAAVGLTTGNELVLSLSSVLEQFSVDRRRLDIDSGALTPGESVRDTEIGAGGLVAIIIRGGRYAGALEVSTAPPEMLPTGEEALRFHTRGARHRNIGFAGGLSFRLTSRLFIGFTFSHDYSRLRLRYARDTALADAYGPRGITSNCGGAPCGVENPLATEYYDVDASSKDYFSASNVRAHIGLVVQLYRDVWLGVGYHSPPGVDIETELTGEINVQRAPRDGGDRLRGDASVLVHYPASVDAEVRARLPRGLDLHVGGRWEDLSRMRAFDVRSYTRQLTDAGVPEWMRRPRGMRDSFAVWAGLEQIDFGQPWLFGGRIGMQSAATNEHTTSPIAIEPISVTLDAGAQARVGSGILQLTYGVRVFPGVDVVDSEFDPRHQLACADSGFDYTTRSCQAAREGFAIPTAAGDYARIQHALRLAFRYEWN